MHESADEKQHDLYQAGSLRLVWRGVAHDMLTGNPRENGRTSKRDRRPAQQNPRTLAQFRWEWWASGCFRVGIQSRCHGLRRGRPTDIPKLHCVWVSHRQSDSLGKGHFNWRIIASSLFEGRLVPECRPGFSFPKSTPMIGSSELISTPAAVRRAA